MTPETTPVAFSLALADKDLRLIDDLAEASGTDMPQAAVNLEVIRAAEASIGRGRRLLDGRQPPATGGPPMTDRP